MREWIINLECKSVNRTNMARLWPVFLNNALQQRRANRLNTGIRGRVRKHFRGSNFSKVASDPGAFVWTSRKFCIRLFNYLTIHYIRRPPRLHALFSTIAYNGLTLRAHITLASPESNIQHQPHARVTAETSGLPSISFSWVHICFSLPSHFNRSPRDIITEMFLKLRTRTHM